MKGLLQELKDQKSVFTLQSDKYADNGGQGTSSRTKRSTTNSRSR